MDLSHISQTIVPLVTTVALKILGALVIWLIARQVIGMVSRLVVRSFRLPFDQTVAGYIGTAVSVVLNIGLVLGILGFFGIETTSFAALLAGAGIAVGAAWGGLLTHLAAGIFLLILRPIKIGDFVQAGGVVGTVQEIGLFVTAIDTPDNVRTFIGNNRIFSDTIQNFTTNPYRRVDLTAQLHVAVEPGAASRLLRERLARIPHVLAQPAPDVEILTFTQLGPVLAVRPYCHNDHYWRVYFDTNRVIREAFGEAGFPAPEQPVLVRTTA